MASAEGAILAHSLHLSTEIPTSLIFSCLCNTHPLICFFKNTPPTIIALTIIQQSARANARHEKVFSRKSQVEPNDYR